MLKIKLKDNSELEVEEGLSVIDMCRNRWRSCRLKNNSRIGLFTKHINI